jgi:hypothetical protein
VLVNASHATLEDAEKSLDRVRGNVATGVLFRAVIDGLMRGEFSAHGCVERAFIGVQTRLAAQRARH